MTKKFFEASNKLPKEGQVSTSLYGFLDNNHFNINFFIKVLLSIHIIKP